MINKIKEINNFLIIKHQNNPHELKVQLLIKKILAEENCFLKMNINTAYAILRDLEIDENRLDEVYSKLINIT